MQRTLRARMLSKLIFLLHNTDIESLEYEIKLQKVKDKETNILSILCEKTVDIFNKNHRHHRENIKNQLILDYISYVVKSKQFVDDKSILGE